MLFGAAYLPVGKYFSGIPIPRTSVCHLEWIGRVAAAESLILRDGVVGLYA